MRCAAIFDLALKSRSKDRGVFHLYGVVSGPLWLTKDNVAPIVRRFKSPIG
jgi:hypothetical protein